MNYLVLIVCVFLVVMTLLGYRRGFLKSVFSFIAVVAAMAITYYCTPYIASYVTKNTDLDEGLTAYFTNILNDSLYGDLESREEQKQALSESGLPAVIQSVLADNNNKEFYQALGVDQFVSYVAGYFTGIVINLCCYLFVYFVVWLILHIVVKAFNWIAEFPILKGVNRLGGAVFGFVKGIILLEIFFLIVTLISNFETGKNIVKMIESNEILCWLYQNNPILNIITDITRQLF